MGEFWPRAISSPSPHPSTKPSRVAARFPVTMPWPSPRGSWPRPPRLRTRRRPSRGRRRGPRQGLARAPQDRFSSCREFGVAVARSLTLPAARESVPTALSLSHGRGSVDGIVFETPRSERRLGQVVLGAVVVMTTAALLIHTAFHASESASEASSALPVPSATATSIHRHSPANGNASNRPAHPHADPRAEPTFVVPPPSASVTTSRSSADAGAASAPIGSLNP